MLVARSEPALERLRDELTRAYAIQVHVAAADLAVPGAPASLFGFLKQRNLQLDLLVNNAGQGDYGEFANCSPESLAALIQLNITALSELTRLALPGMLERHRGTVLNLASTAALRPGPWLATYGATKAYVISLTESIACELAGTGVRVLAVCPGPTNTSFREVAGMGATPSKNIAGQVEPTEVADFAVRAISRRSNVFIHGFGNRLTATLMRWLPRRLQARLVRGRREKPQQRR